MGHHSDPPVAQPISADQALQNKLAAIRGDLSNQLSHDFATLLGAKLPDPSACAIFTSDVDLIAVTTPVATVAEGYEAGAEGLVQASDLSSEARTEALAVVRSMLSYVVAAGTITAGGYGCAALCRDSTTTRAAAVFSEVDFGSKQDWETPVDFHILLFAFVIWAPSGLAGDVSRNPELLPPTRWADST